MLVSEFLTLGSEGSASTKALGQERLARLWNRGSL